jgi:ribosomal protein L32
MSHDLHETLISLPTCGSLGHGKLPSHDILDCGMDIGEIIERCEGDIFLFAVCDEI